MSEVGAIVAASGAAPNGEAWALHYRPFGIGGPHDLTLLVEGHERESGSGFDIPGTTELGFGGGLTPGEGNYYLYGITSSRIHIVRAESRNEDAWCEVTTAHFPEAAGDDGSSLRTFVLVRPPVENVTALVALAQDGRVVQRRRLH